VPGQLDKYAQCLAAASDTSEGSDKASAGARVRLHGEDLARCHTLVREARDMAPASRARGRGRQLPFAVQAGQKLEAVMRSSAALRARCWPRAASGSGRSWRSRRSSTAAKRLAHAPLRPGRQCLAARDQVRSPSAPVSGRTSQRLNDAYSMFLDYAENARPELARTTGQRFHESRAGHHGRGATHGRQAAQRIRRAGACRRLVAAFNALVVE